MTLQEALIFGYALLRKEGIETAQLDAQLLLAHVLATPRENFFFVNDRPLTKDELNQFEAALLRRKNFEPVAKITRQKNFWKSTFFTSADTLDPRPDSETLIEAVLEKFQNSTKELRILDLGVGTGCLLFSLLQEYPKAWGLGVDKSLKALNIAQQNQKKLLLEERSSLLASNWCKALKMLAKNERSNGFDVIVSNPPYISKSNRHALPLELSFDPSCALFAGIDGLEDYKKLAESVPNLLKNDGLFFLEMGAQQQVEISSIFQLVGLKPMGFKEDLAGIPRCAIFARLT